MNVANMPYVRRITHVTAVGFIMSKIRGSTIQVHTPKKR